MKVFCRYSPTAWREFIMFDKWLRSTVSTRDSVFWTTSIWYTEHRLYAACYGKRVWGLVALECISFCRNTRKTRSIERRPGSGRPTKMTTAEGTRRVADEGRWRNDCRSAARTPCNGYRMTLILVLIILFTNRSPKCCAILLFCSTQWKKNAPYFQHSIKTKR